MCANLKIDVLILFLSLCIFLDFSIVDRNIQNSS